MTLKTTTIEPESQEMIEIEPGKVGFLWSITSDKRLKFVIVDDMYIQEGSYNPPFVVKKYVGVFTGGDITKVTYDLQVLGDRDSMFQKRETSEEKVIITEERRPKTASIQNYILNDAGTWYEIKIQKNILTWSLRLREEQTPLLYTYDPSHANYATLPAGETLTEDTSPNRGINAIYVMCNTAGVTVEFEVWTDGFN